MITVIVGLAGFVVGAVVALLVYRNNTKKVAAALDVLKQGGDASEVLKDVYKVLK